MDGIKGQAKPEQIEAWKKEYGEIFVAEADDCVAYFKKPSRSQLSYAMTLQSDPLKMTETILKACFIGGSEVMINDLDHLLGASAIADSLITSKQVAVKKL